MIEDSGIFESVVNRIRDGGNPGCLKSTRSKVYDRDGDGLVNCIDYTITFKKEWDAVMPPNQCEIVRNYDTVGRSKR